MSTVIRIDASRCLNDRFGKVSCSRCKEVCPTGAISHGLLIDCDLCIGCGLCIGACPADAAAVEGYRTEELEKLLSSPPDILACNRQSEESRWPCLGFLDSRLLLAIALKSDESGRELAVDDYACCECRPEVAESIRRTLDEVNGGLAASGRGKIRAGKAAPTWTAQERRVSRRGLIKSLFGLAGEAVREAVSAGGGQCDPMSIRECLHPYKDSGLTAHPGGRFRSVRFGEGCNCCGICLRNCPDGALRAVDSGAELEFYHHPVLCTGCNVCVSYCPRSVITLDRATELQERPVKKVGFPRCNVCGMVFQPRGNQPVCFECLLCGKDSPLGTDKKDE